MIIPPLSPLTFPKIFNWKSEEEMKTIEIIALLKSARIMRRELIVEETCCHLKNSHTMEWKKMFLLLLIIIRAFHISVSRWFFTGVWVTASLLKSPRLFLVFWPFSTMLSFRWSLLVRQLPSPLVPLAIL